MSFWFKTRQIVVMDAHGGKPARNFYVRTITVAITMLLLVTIPFALGAWYAPFQHNPDTRTENLRLKQQNQHLQRKLTEMTTIAQLKDGQIDALKEQLADQEREVQQVTKELQMFKSILEERKGKGIQVMRHQASWESAEKGAGHIIWQALFVKGGTYPRYITGTYQLIATDTQGHSQYLFETPEKYRFETHIVLDKKIKWKQAWKPIKLELVVYNYRKKEVLKQIIPIQGR